MAILASVSPPYIYEFTFNGYTYIGQTTTTNRMYEHIINTYYHNDGNPFHVQLQKVRLDQVKIKYYTKANNYGISNFTAAKKEFAHDWRSLSDPGNNDTPENYISDLDFAEIFHILKAQYEGKKLLNTQMGGKANGFIHRSSVNNTTKYKTLMKTYTPQQALNVVLTGGARANIIIQNTRQAMDKIFSPEWPQYYRQHQKQLKTLAPNSVNLHMSLYEFIINKLTLSTKYIEYNNSTQKVVMKSNFFANMNNEIYNNFIIPRVAIIQAIVNKQFGENFQIPVNFKPSWNWEEIANYITQAINNTILQYNRRVNKQTKNGIEITADLNKMIQKVKLYNALLIWDVKNPHKKANANWLLGYDINNGTKESEVNKKMWSYQVFNYAMKQTRDSDIFNPLEQVGGLSNYEGLIPYTDDTIVIKAYHLSNSEWLSSRVHTWYKQHAPAYNNQWLKFYRPMVSYWRTDHNRDIMVQENFDDKNWIMTQSKQGNSIIVYKNNNPEFVFNLSDLNQITIY